MPTIPKKQSVRPWVTPREPHAGRKNPNSEIYNKTRWRKTRMNFLIKYPLCAECYKNKKYVGARVVDHKKRINELTPDEEWMIYDECNLQGLCDTCHNQKSGREGAAVTNQKRKK